MTEKTARQIENMKAQTYGVEVEGNGITRQKAAMVAATHFGTGRYEYTAHRNGYMTWSAYGSNLSVEQMAHRCPGAKIAGMAYLQDWKLVFRYHATIEPCEGRVVPVLIWEIGEQDERSLDMYEGYVRP